MTAYEKVSVTLEDNLSKLGNGDLQILISRLENKLEERRANLYATMVRKVIDDIQNLCDAGFEDSKAFYYCGTYDWETLLKLIKEDKEIED
jgi:hypothetical protein